MKKKPNISGKIFLHGFQSNPFSYIAKANLFVLASRFEGFPNVLLEAGVLGIPLVAFDNPGGMAEIINNDKIGLLAKSNNSADLAKKIDLALKLSVNLKTIKQRISERKTLERRADDNDKIAIKRYEMYENNIKPVIDFYKQLDLLKVVNGEASIHEISNEIRDLITSIKGWLCDVGQYKYAENLF